MARISKRRYTRLGGKAAHLLVLGTISLLFVAPILFMFIGSLKPNELVLTEGSSWRAFVPTAASLDNYVGAFRRAEFDRLFVNSVIVTVSTIVLGLTVNSMLGYALARLRFRGRRLVMLIVIALITIPLQAFAIPLLLMLSRIGWVDTYHIQIAPFIAAPFFIYMFYTHFLDLPKELEEAAAIDGAGPMRTFLSIIVPLAKPAYASAAIIGFLFYWGELLWPVLVTRGPEVRPLPVGIAVFQHLPPVQWGETMAFATMMTIPILIVFLVFQRAFVRSVARQGVKG